MLKGVDVSSWQPAIDWPATERAGYDFAIVKCTGGTTYRNPHYAAQVAGARAAGFAIGHYHFSHEATIHPPPGAGPEAEADFFLSQVDVRAGELVALDIEDTAIVGNLGDWALRWLRRVEAAVGCKPLLYTFPDYLRTRHLGTEALAAYPLWYAHYWTPYASQPWPVTPLHWARIAIWQWNGGIAVPGMPSDTDGNLFPGTLAELRALGKPDDHTPPPPPRDDAGSVTWGVTAGGGPELTIRFGGRATSVLGVDLADVGISVVGEDGHTYDRSIQAGVWGPWRKR